MNDNVTSCGSLTTSNTADTITGSYYYDESSPNINDWRYLYDTPFYPAPTNVIITNITEYKKNKGDNNMRYLYGVILINPKTDEFFTTKVVAKSETSALMEAYSESKFSNIGKISDGFIAVGVSFDDLKYNCKQLMEWKKEKSLEKALETIKKAVE